MPDRQRRHADTVDAPAHMGFSWLRSQTSVLSKLLCTGRNLSVSDGQGRQPGSSLCFGRMSSNLQACVCSHLGFLTPGVTCTFGS